MVDLVGLLEAVYGSGGVPEDAASVVDQGVDSWVSVLKCTCRIPDVVERGEVCDEVVSSQLLRQRLGLLSRQTDEGDFVAVGIELPGGSGADPSLAPVRMMVLVMSDSHSRDVMAKVRGRLREGQGRRRRSKGR